MAHELAITPVSAMPPLHRLNQAVELLAQARSVDEVLQVRDLAEAARVYARQARLGLEAQNHAAEIKLRAERRAGELLADVPRGPGSRGGRPDQRQVQKTSDQPGLRFFPDPDEPELLPEPEPPTVYQEVLDRAEIAPTTARRWQQIASVPEEVFSAYVESSKQHGRELTTAGLAQLARERQPAPAPARRPATIHMGAPAVRLIVGDVMDGLRSVASKSVQTVVTSPPYFQLRQYGELPEELGREDDPQVYIGRLVEIFREVHRTLRDDGSMWVNLGFTYAGSGRGPTGWSGMGNAERRQGFSSGYVGDDGTLKHGGRKNKAAAPPGYKAKDLIPIPFLLASALQADGWWLRSIIAWCKTAPMRESVMDRPTSAWEPILFLAKSDRTFYDQDAVREASHRMTNAWVLPPEPSSSAHTARYPTEVPRRAIEASTKTGDLVLDPFIGSGTSALVAAQLGRACIGIDLYEQNIHEAERRIGELAPVTIERC